LNLDLWGSFGVQDGKRMPPASTFFRRLRRVWITVNVAILVVTASGYRDLSSLTFILSFPADVVIGVLLLPVSEGVASSGRPWLNHLLFGTILIISGYVQWFVIGRAVVERMSARFPSRRVVNVGRVGIVVGFLGLTFLGLAMVRADDEAGHYRDRARTVREGMTIDEVRSELGDPQSDVAATTENAGLCPAGTARVTSHWYEHEWLPRPLSRDSFFLPLCLDRQGKVVAVLMGRAD
jgi:hypothetical protein